MTDLIKRIQAGDEYAFKQLTTTIENDLYKIAKTRLNNDDDIKDAIQNTMILTYKNIKKIRNIEYFKTWMIHVLINECNKIYNSNKKSNEIYNRVISDSKISSYDSSIQDLHDKMDFNVLIEKLNYDERLVITLYYNSLFSCSQIAKILKTNTNTIKSRLRRSKQKLREMYKEGYLYDIK